MSQQPKQTVPCRGCGKNPIELTDNYIHVRSKTGDINYLYHNKLCYIINRNFAAYKDTEVSMPKDL